MARLLTGILIVAVIASVCAAPAPKKNSGKAEASDGSIGVGIVAGGEFDAGSFSIGHGGSAAGSGDGGHGGNQGTNTYGGQGGDSGHSSYS